jgi:hypothetical protein
VSELHSKQKGRCKGKEKNEERRRKIANLRNARDSCELRGIMDSKIDKHWEQGWDEYLVEVWDE